MASEFDISCSWYQRIAQNYHTQKHQPQKHRAKPLHHLPTSHQRHANNTGTTYTQPTTSIVITKCAEKLTSAPTYIHNNRPIDTPYTILQTCNNCTKVTIDQNKELKTKNTHNTSTLKDPYIHRNSLTMTINSTTEPNLLPKPTASHHTSKTLLTIAKAISEKLTHQNGNQQNNNTLSAWTMPSKSKKTDISILQLPKTMPPHLRTPTAYPSLSECKNHRQQTGHSTKVES
jgi:hypothetical protein